MAKKNFGTKLFAAALATFALASCQSESTLLEPAANNLRDVELSITVSKGELTRTNLNLSEDEKKLLLTWNEGDVIQVSETDGKYAGFLTVTKLIDNGTKAQFVGTVRTFADDGKHTFTFISLGKDVKYSAKQGVAMPNKVYDFSNQINQGVEALAANDLLMTTGDVEIKGGKATFNDLFMHRQFGFGHFTLLYNNEPLTFDANTVVTVSKSDMNAGAEIEFPTTVTAKGEKSFTVATSENDFYVTLVPGTEKTPLEFTVTVGEYEYKGYSNPYLLEANDFYRLAIEDGQELAKARAIPINVVRTDGYDDTKDYTLVYNQNFGTNETKTIDSQSAGNKCTFAVSDYNEVFDAANEGYDFIGWNTAADGTGEAFAANTTITVEAPATSATLYAQWKESTYNWTVTWKDGYTEDPIKSENYNGTDGMSIVGEYPEDPTREGYSFKGWDKYIDKLSKNETNVVITAQWKKDVVNYVLTYHQNLNGSTLTIDDQPDPATTADSYDFTVVNYEDLGPVWTSTTPEGYKFIGWNTQADGKGKTYAPNDIYTLTKDQVTGDLYAQWEEVKKTTVTTPGYGHGEFK
ncbi:MAG: InlB B-repeat-containing protein [Muribaculaceae bacterium]|nr:InlB B-repeat-containing protein [Muribaculaceae bacterium]